MSERRNATRQRWTKTLVFLLLAMAWALGAALLVLGRPGDASLWPVAGFAVGGMVVISWVMVWLRKRFRCPVCGGAVQAPALEDEGDAALRRCPSCDIDWHIGSV